MQTDSMICETCNLIKVKAWTHSEELECENRHDPGDFLGENGCCRCKLLLGEKNTEKCNCCFCIFGYHENCHNDCNHRFCHMSYSHHVKINIQFCECNVDVFARECVRCVAEGKDFKTYSLYDDRVCMLKLIDIGYNHKRARIPPLEFLKVRTDTQKDLDRSILQKFYDVGYYRIISEIVKSAIE